METYFTLKYIIILTLFCFSELTLSQTSLEMIQEIETYRAEENEKFATAETTILTPEDFKLFKGLPFYAIDLAYRIEAVFVRTPDETPFEMPTTTDRLPVYVKYGEAHFKLNGESLQLALYQSVPPMEDPEYVDYLFLPFTDTSNGEDSYGGGRFVDARIPEGKTMIIDFNKAYNPYCAYSPNYSCPIPPEENDLKVAIKAGVKYVEKH
ncbi:MAG: DUF1684 domain-containing protein [Bacteroidetes bacterium]|nr:DUF1684 domain-containing protein [Bacteroidota bacterium]